MTRSWPISQLPKKDQVKNYARENPGTHSEGKLARVAKANGALNVVTNSHKGIRRAALVPKREAIGRRPRTWPRFIGHGHDLFDAFKCLLYRAGRWAAYTHIHKHTYTAFPASFGPIHASTPFSILGRILARRPSAEIFKVFSHERRRPRDVAA